MQQHALNFGQRANFASLLSLIHPNKELFQRHRALLRRAMPAGLPIASENDVGHGLYLNEQLIQHKESTFFMRYAGESMCDLGIFDGDLLVVDRAVPALDGSVVIAAMNGELAVKQMIFSGEGRILRTAHLFCPDIVIKPDHDLSIWGVVQWNVHKV